MTAKTPEAVFAAHRRELFGIAYRVLGTVTDAEDVIQDAYVRYQQAIESGVHVAAPKAYLSAVVSRLAIDVLRSARIRRQDYSGEWLPEPLLTDHEADPAWVAEQADSVSMAALLVLERLSPTQRAVFVLHDVFGYQFSEISQIVGRPVATCRQLAGRARRHLQAERTRFRARHRDHERLAAGFFKALNDGEVDRLITMLTEDIEVHGDGGGQAPQWDHPITGPARAARLLVSVGKLTRRLHLTIEPAEVNVGPGAVVRDEQGRIAAIWSLHVVEGRIQTVRCITNPDKLRHLGPVADAQQLIHQRAAHSQAREARPSNAAPPLSHT